MRLVTRASPERIVILDSLRGLSILLMVLYHFGYDLVAYCGAPYGLIHNPLLDALQPFFAGLFILISGISCRFSRNNLRRALEFAAAALVITGVTYLAGAAVYFGIIHFMAAAALIGQAATPLFDRLHRTGSRAVAVATPLVLAALFAVFRILTRASVDFPGFFWLGFRGAGFSSSDYFPILPWIFVYFIGLFFGAYIKEGRFPARFYSFKEPFFSACGRNTLLIYLLHQPALMGIVFVINLFRAS